MLEQEPECINSTLHGPATRMKTSSAQLRAQKQTQPIMLHYIMQCNLSDNGMDVPCVCIEILCWCCHK